ncbi:BZ3500_MvSof-1268-A1-R1_Chr4-1g06734 [Microbotryum saponariae]|uniref:BZ3500_MvSof-1268-A1-R1_Chr4-1g06734 protein n=1 Tax=Microbotryum saponariae TaxID=289078 RepID=A0A2X0LKH4_9BASI|nr:BZ3500_MvSof-1268-A1-R1_Chr4-1g06734 [Microbotryum saponariae]SDA06399.1 BZ3501_MvSof-1269-A2-R1_Chr4-1g06444 [Microbotryum saponariae]
MLVSLSNALTTSLVVASLASTCAGQRWGIPAIPGLQIRAVGNATTKGSKSTTVATQVTDESDADAEVETSTTTTRQKVATTSAFKSIRFARPFGNPTGSVTNPTTVAAIASSAAAATASYSRAAAAATTSSASSGTGGTASKNVGSSIIIDYTASLSTPANTTIISANIATNNITGFNAATLGNNTGAIASWFRTNNSADFTNGHSWCYNIYNDTMPGFAPSFKTMTTNYGGDAIKAGEAYCGLEAIFYLPSGKNVTLYVVDAFDDTWVKTPSSIDVVVGAYQNEMIGRAVTSKNDVLTDVTWHFTGNRSTELVTEIHLTAGRAVRAATPAAATDN